MKILGEIHSRRNHAKHLIFYHIIFSTKYRRKCLDKILPELKQSFNRAEKMSNHLWKIELVETDKEKINHVHFLIKATPQISPGDIIHKLKQISTYDMWHNEKCRKILSKFYWKTKTHKHLLWTNGYFCSSIGNASTEVIRNYIASQG